MAKLTTKPNPKSKRISETDAKMGMDQVWEEDKIATPQALTDSLKRISEHAKDWEEMPRPRKETPTALPAKESSLIPSRATPRSSVNWTKWGTLVGVVMIIMLAAQTALLGWQTMTLTTAVEKLNTKMTSLTDTMENLIDAESPGRID